MSSHEPWIDKYELARRLGLVDPDGHPVVSGIEDKAASGEWPSRKVLGKLRFAPEDEAEIKEMCARGGSHATAPLAAPPAPAQKRRRRTPDQSSRSGPGLTGFVSRPQDTRKTALT